MESLWTGACQDRLSSCTAGGSSRHRTTNIRHSVALLHHVDVGARLLGFSLQLLDQDRSGPSARHNSGLVDLNFERMVIVWNVAGKAVKLQWSVWEPGTASSCRSERRPGSIRATISRDVFGIVGGRAVAGALLAQRVRSGGGLSLRAGSARLAPRGETLH